jgi:light-regulated signal transduction histidine kinase (bacteriophytochrome)
MINIKNKTLLITLGLIMFIFFIVKSLSVFGYIECNKSVQIFEYFCFILFCIPAFFFVKVFLRKKNEEYQNTVQQLRYKNTYLEHAAKILRHDMHSGINVYIPKVISAIERRLPKDIIQEYKLENSLKLLKEGLSHTQKVYRGVFEFTNLVKEGNGIELKPYKLSNILTSYLDSTSYKEQVVIDTFGLPTINVNEPLFCTAIDNLIRNGLKYNDSETKVVAIFMLDENTMVVQDNGRGMTNDEFQHMSKTNTRKQNQKETGSGLGLGICTAILNEHGFVVSCDKIEEGTQVKIKIK